MTGGKRVLAARRLAATCFASPCPRDRDPTLRRVLRIEEQNQGAFVVSRSDRVSPGGGGPADAFAWKASAEPLAPFSSRSRRPVRQRGMRRAPRPASRPPIALRLWSGRDARCVGPTSAVSRSSYEHPRLVGSQMRRLPRGARAAGESPVSRQSDSLRWAAVPPDGEQPEGLVISLRVVRGRTSDVPVAPSVQSPPLARSALPRRPPRPSFGPPRERCGLRGDRGRLPSDEGYCPAALSRAPGSSLPRSARLGRPCASVRSALINRRNLFRGPGGPAPVHASPLPAGSRFSEPRAPPADFCNL